MKIAVACDHIVICIESSIGERSSISEPIWNWDVNAPE